MDHLKPESLDWALTHILKYGDTDIVPPLFEYEAIKHSWPSVRDTLIREDLGKRECRPLRKFLVPKPQGGYRVTVQLDPFDALIYTAMVREAAQDLENHRIPKEQRVACSYRVELTSDGQLFQPGNGWNDFHARSQELMDEHKPAYVVVADIADFYNMIGHHRVTHAFEMAGITKERAQIVEYFLLNLTGGHSRGVPVGPSASVLIAEAVLADVDSFLLRKGYVHTRYVDDFRIFCKSRTQAFQVLYDLADYLYTSHRLALQANKTTYLTAKEFEDTELLDPHKLEEASKTQKINEILRALEAEFGYGFSVESDLPSIAQQRIVRQNICELFDAALAKKQLPLGLTRYLLRRGAKLRTNVIEAVVLNHLEKLAPVMRDVCLYLSKAVRGKDGESVATRLIEFVTESDIAFMPFVRLWVIHLLTEQFSAESGPALVEICNSALIREQLGVRPFALLARERQHIDWVREQRETWHNFGPWDRRAIIWASSVLADDDRKYWLARIQNSGDSLERVVALAAANASKS